MLTDSAANASRSEGLIPCACPRCGSSEAKPRLRSPDRQFPNGIIFEVGECLSCGLLRQTPRISPADLIAHYPTSYGPYGEREIELDGSLANHLRWRKGYHSLSGDFPVDPRPRGMGRILAQRLLIPDFVEHGRLLEVGCASGNRLALLRRLGWGDCRGNEYSVAAADRARERGFDIAGGPIEDALGSFADGSLDAVVASFVMEHLADPFATTRVLASKLKRGGQFLFSTINVSSLDFWLYGQHWYDLDLPRHLVFFRRRDLCAMLAADFSIEEIGYESSPTDYQGSARYRVRDGVGGWRGFLDSMILRAGRRLELPLDLLGRAGFGGRIYMAARKK